MSSRASTRITSTQPRNSTQKQSYFMKTLEEVGVDLHENEEAVILSKEQSLVIRDISKYILNDSSYPENVTEFTKDIEKYVGDKESFHKMLSSTILKKSNGRDNIETRIPQDSLFRILLNVDVVQSNIMNIILDEVTSVVSEDNADAGWLRLLLNSLRYLSNIKDSDILTTKLLDILEIASYPCQLEILNMIPEIFPDSQYDETAKQLSKLLISNNNLTGAILDCLNCFSLNTDLRGEVQNHIISNLFTSCKHEYFPVLFEFLVTDCKADNIQNILFKCRNIMDAILGTESDDKDMQSSKALVLNRLYACAAIPKLHYEGWINMITGIRVNTDHKPIDIMILFILYKTHNSRKKPIEGLFKKRIKTNLFKVNLLDNLFKKYIICQFLNDYIGSIIKIGISLLRHHNDINMIEFGSQLLKLLFSHNLTSRVYRQDILHNLILLASTSEEKTVENVLVLLNDLSKDDPPKISGHIMQLMMLLEKLDTFELPAVKQTFDLLCSLTCGPNAEESASNFKDEIHILVRKQLSCSKRSEKLKGIISAITMVKHIASVLEDQSSVHIPDESIMSITDIPQGPPQEAASLLELINTSSSYSPEYMSVYYDQLATMIINAENLEKHFLAWMFETITNDFQDVFVTENVPGPINDIPITVQYSLNLDDEVDVPININIAEFTIKKQENPSILVLSPLFRLLRLLHYQYENGNLSSIDALLGCGVLMPNMQDIEDYDIDQIKQIADCIFTCINWFREVVSAFVTQKNKNLRIKVINRIQHIIELEKLLKKCMEFVPDHKLPVSYYYNANIPAQNKIESPVKSPRPKKKFKSKAAVAGGGGDVTATTSVTLRPQNKVAPKKQAVKDFNFSFREIDIDIILLLKYPLKVDGHEAPLAQSTQTVPESGTQTVTTINLKQFQFLMQDFIKKLHVLTKNVSLGLSNLSIVKPVDVVTDSMKLFPCINRHFNNISDCLSKSLIDGPDDSDADEMVLLKECFNSVLECYSLIFGWSGFQTNKHLLLLRDCLKSLRGEEQTQLNSANRLIVDFAMRMSTHVDQCTYLTSGVRLIQILQSLYKINMSPEIQKKTMAVSNKLLMIKWKNLKGTLESGKTFVANLDILSKAYLDGASVKSICNLIGTLQTQVADLQDKSDRLEVLKSFDRTNYYILFKNICSALLDRIKTDIASLTNSQHLVLWKTVALSMQGLMTIAKVHEIRQVLVCFLKKSLGILKVFMSHGIPILEIMLRTKTEEVTEIFKTLQTSTRFLHHLCCYSKLTKDSSLIAFVPQFRLTLETLIYKVKGALIANDCSAAFWMGNLRNKDIHGADITTQSTENSGQSSQQNDEELLPDDDSDEDMDVADANEDEDQDTASEVYE